MVEPISIVTESVISAFLETSIKAIAEKLQRGRKLTEVETMTLLVTERFNSVEREMRSGQQSLENRFESLESELKAIRDRLGAIDTRHSIADDIAQLKAKVAQPEARG